MNAPPNTPTDAPQAPGQPPKRHGVRGFGVSVDLESGTARSWFIGADGVKRWADGTPCPTPASGGESTP